MDDTTCRAFFAHPATSLHRRFEALRAVFLDHRPLTEIAVQFGYRYGTLRNLVAQFRAQGRTGQIPPFSPPRLTDGLRDQNRIILQHNPIPKPRLIATNSL
jgi:Helix-turn-helix domain